MIMMMISTPVKTTKKGGGGGGKGREGEKREGKGRKKGVNQVEFFFCFSGLYLILDIITSQFLEISRK